MPSQLRIQRIADRILQELSEILLMQISDPRLTGVYPTSVRVDREVTYADIFVSAIEGQVRSQEIIEGLSRANGFLRTALAQRIHLRVFPRLRFHWDPTPERADHIEKLLNDLHQESKPDEKTKN